MAVTWAEDATPFDTLNEVLSLAKVADHPKKAKRYVFLGEEIQDLTGGIKARRNFLKSCEALDHALRELAQCSGSKLIGKYLSKVISLAEHAKSEVTLFQRAHDRLEAIDAELAAGKETPRTYQEYQTILTKVESMQGSLHEEEDASNLYEISDTGPLHENLKTPLHGLMDKHITQLGTIESEPPDASGWVDVETLQEIVEERREEEAHSRKASVNAEDFQWMEEAIHDCQTGLEQRVIFKKQLLTMQKLLKHLTECLKSGALEQILKNVEGLLGRLEIDEDKLSVLIEKLVQLDKDINNGATLQDVDAQYKSLFRTAAELNKGLEYIHGRSRLDELSDLIESNFSPEAAQLLQLQDSLELPESPWPKSSWVGLVDLVTRIENRLEEERERLEEEERERLEDEEIFKTAVKTKPSYPNPRDDYQPTDPVLWKRMLEVASGDRLEYTQNDRTVHAPNDGRGYRNMPNNPKGIAWAVKQYNGYDGNWKGKTATRWLEDVELSQTVQGHEDLFRRLAAGGVEVTQGEKTHELRALEAKGLVRLAGVQGDRHYWDFTESGRQCIGPHCKVG